MEIIKIFLLIIISYLIGAIPFSFIICMNLKKIDLRTVGSKNVGATNAGRVLGKHWFFIITILDAAKGLLIIWGTKYLIKTNIIPSSSLLLIIAGIIVIIGHTYPIYLKFKGGKGVAVSAGVLLALDYRILLVSLATFIIIVMVTKYISLGSTIGSALLPLSVLFFYYNKMNYSFLIFCCLISLYVILKHKENIKRLFNGTERKWGEKIKT